MMSRRKTSPVEVIDICDDDDDNDDLTRAFTAGAGEAGAAVCDISDKSEDLCLSQHANAFSATLPKSVAKSAGMSPTEYLNAKTEYFADKGVLDRAGRAKLFVETPYVNKESPKGSYVKKATPRTLLKGKALKEWMIDRGFATGDTKKANAKLKTGKFPVIGKGTYDAD
jgi:hypothetical protein